MAQNLIKDFGGARQDWLSKSAICVNRPSTYHVDGTGRDTYIGKNNGGLYAKFSPAPAPTMGTFDCGRVGYNVQRPRVESKHSNYHSIGCGRDSYIS
jgi:hypothetical protein